MNILFLDSIERRTYGGMEEWIRLVALGLSKRGHTAVIAGRDGSEFLRRCAKSGIPAVSLNISGDFNPLTIVALRNVLRARQIDCLCVNFNKDIRLGGLASRTIGEIPVVWSVGLDIVGSGWVHRRLTPKLIDSVIVPSESLKRQITSHGSVDQSIVEVISIGIEDTPGAKHSDQSAEWLRHEFGIADDATIAVTVGRMVTQKGHIFLLEAMPALIAKWPRLRFVWLGDGPLTEPLRVRASELGVSDYVKFVGMREDVASILAGCDLMVHPSIEEPFGIAVLEGMRAGLPIVASEVGGIPEVVGGNKGAMLVAAKAPTAIAEAVGKVLSDKRQMLQMGEANRRRFEDHFSLDRMLDRVERHFESILGMVKRHG